MQFDRVTSRVGESLRRAAAARLEAGWTHPLPVALSRIWSKAAAPSRSVDLPPNTRVVGIGGATLGGSSKTPVTLELARALARRGNRVAVVAHGYRATLRAARIVRSEDSVRRVGDEALWLARALGPLGAPVVTARRRNDALALAAGLAPLVLVDGLLQSRPRPLALSVLALDASEPWGSGICPPAGDLKARRDALVLAADFVLTVRGRIAGAIDPSGTKVSVSDLRQMRLGLVLAIARPLRVVRALEDLGIRCVVTRTAADHGAPAAPKTGSARVDAWLTTGKCATKLGQRFAGAPVLVLDHHVDVPEELLRRIEESGPPFTNHRSPFRVAP